MQVKTSPEQEEPRGQWEVIRREEAKGIKPQIGREVVGVEKPRQRDEPMAQLQIAIGCIAGEVKQKHAPCKADHRGHLFHPLFQQSCDDHSRAQQGQPAQEQPEQKAPQDKDTFSIYQIRGGDETRDLRFEPYDRLIATGHRVDPKNYALVYSAELTPGTSLEDIYTRFNIDHPKDFKGHSLSVSDVVVLHQNGQDTAHYVDSFGYKDVPEFFKEQEKALIPDDLETGETIKTPRGTFYVTAMSREQMEAAGYGLHHQSDDGKYLIMGNGTRAFAVPVQPENYLKAAEQTTEQNYNMIDGQINNTPTTAELEAKVKAGETISLVDLAEAVKADKERGKAAKTEKKPSIRAQLRADKEKTAQKKAAKSKNHELEV